MPKISIIMPTYNRSWIIGRAIKSVLAQTFTDFELIISNDGSTDDSDIVLQEYTDSRIRVIKQEANHGLAAARNYGLETAKGELIAYLDTDNIWYPNFLEATLEAFDDSSTVMAYSGQNLLLVGGSRASQKILGRMTRNVTYNPAELIKGNYIDVNCVVHKKELLEKLGYFDESLKVLEDWDLFARIAIAYPFQVRRVDQVLSEYYFYLPETEKTLSNQQWHTGIMEEFGLNQAEGDDLKVRTKLAELLKESR